MPEVAADAQRLQQSLKELPGQDPQDQSEADWEVYRRMSGSAEAPRRNFFRVDTSRDIDPALEKIVL